MTESPVPVTKRLGLTGSSLKLIAIVCMLVDHIAWAFVPTVSAAGVIMHTVGRITAPVMCFMLAEGYRHTHSFRKYAYRLAIFAAISYLPFILFVEGGLPKDSSALLSLNMIYTLLLALLALWADDHLKGADRLMALCGLCFLSLIGDWPVMAILYTLNFARNRENKKRMVGMFILIPTVFTLYSILSGLMSSYPTDFLLAGYLPQMGTILALPLIGWYNGKKGGKTGGKWFFYWFYPVHLLLLALIQMTIYG